MQPLTKGTSTLSNGVSIFISTYLYDTGTEAFTAVVEECGAMPDLEDKEGEVGGIIPLKESFESRLPYCR